MKITNKNIECWILGLIFLIWCYSMFSRGIPKEPDFIGMLNFIGALCFGIGGVAALIIEIIEFLIKCSENEIEFEIDLLKPFRSRHIPPEEEDKKNK